MLRIDGLGNPGSLVASLQREKDLLFGARDGSRAHLPDTLPHHPYYENRAPFSSTGIFPFSWKQMFPESQSKYRPPLPGASLSKPNRTCVRPAPHPHLYGKREGLPDNEAGAYT
ncbi:hypothetical protein CEXT_13031 [Caerostris extrusa]|uniref:Uncharacterized protein n=1 Tax=Caerostris extrusa TaxID=172846 RepID=A0AAV4VB78_CAEEX|nr:hypothetical protein CEXT_13031 [Caerostris extrusa]